MAGFFVHNNHAVLRGVTTTNLKVNMFFNNKSEFAATLSDQFRTSSNWRKAQAKRYTHDTRNGEAAQRLLELESQIVIPDNVWEKARTARFRFRLPRCNLGCCAGVVAAACTQGKRTKHGKPQGVVSDDQPEAREGQAGRPGVAERSVVPRKTGNASGGKGTQLKTDVMRG